MSSLQDLGIATALTLSPDSKAFPPGGALLAPVSLDTFAVLPGSLWFMH